MNPTKEYTLEQLGTFEKSYSFSRALEGDGEYRHIHYGDIHTKLPYIIQKSEVLPTITENQNFETVKYGDILIADASEDYKDLGKSVCFLDSLDTKVISGLHTHRFSPNVSLVKPEYLINLFQTNRYRKFVWKMGTGVSVLGLSKTNIAKYTVTVPSLAKQEEIANHFLNLNKKIQLQQEKIDLLKQQKKAYMQKIFSQQIRLHSPEGKPYSNEWETKKLGDLILQIETGSNELGSEKKSEFVLLKMGNLLLGGFNLSSVQYLSNDQYLNSKKYIANYGDFLFNTRNTLELVGKAATWNKNNTNYVFNSNIARISFNSEIDPFFMNYLYSTDYVWSQVKARAVGTTSVAAVYPRDLYSIKISFPTKEEQIKIAKFFDTFESKIKHETSKLVQLNNQKNAFMQQMFI